ncbi:MAG TPA: PD-(D/E)XK nuclease family protein [Chitinophagaceae bacterium]
MENIDHIKELLNRFIPVQVRVQENNKNETPYYNVFKVLRIEYLEARVHTPFLADLLNPRGLHSQGQIFLDSFLKLVSPEKKWTEYEKENIEIKTEHKTSQGVIDILIFHRNQIKQKRFLIIIENKIFACDQENQIERYYNYALKDLKIPKEQILLVYLKPTRDSPTEFSISGKLKNELDKNGLLKLLGYSPDISAMLLECNESINSQKLKQTIIQYIDILKEFNYGEE